MRDQEIDTTITSSEDKSELTIKLKNEDGQKLSIEDVVLELEYLINQFARAEDELARPGVETH